MYLDPDGTLSPSTGKPYAEIFDYLQRSQHRGRGTLPAWVGQRMQELTATAEERMSKNCPSSLGRATFRSG